MRWIAAIALVTAALARPAAACRELYVDMFTQFDAADRVVLFDVPVQPKDGEKVNLTVVRVLKGAKLAKLSGVQSKERCTGHHFAKGHRDLAIVSAKGKLVKQMFYSEEIVKALEAWRDARPADRHALLEKLARHEEETIATAAKKRLALDAEKQP